jgi:hypothetical protein
MEIVPFEPMPWVADTANVPVDALDKITAPSTNIHAEDLLGKYILAAFSKVGEDGVDENCDTIKAASYLTGDHNVMIGTKVVMAAAAGGINPDQMERDVIRFVGSVIQLDRYSRIWLERFLLSLPWRPVLHHDNARYDESTFQNRQKQLIQDLGAFASPALTDASGNEGPSMQLPAISNAVSVEGVSLPKQDAISRWQSRKDDPNLYAMTTTTPLKVLQTELRFAMLFQRRCPIQPGFANHYAFIGQTMAWLQVMDRATGEVERRCFFETQASSEVKQKFEIQARTAQGDQFEANFVAEGAFVQAPCDDWL